MTATNPTDAMRQYLKQLGMVEASVFRSNNPEMFHHFNYACLPDYVLDRGQNFASDALTEDEKKTILETAQLCGMDFEPKQCFHNAMMLTMFDGTNAIEFCEGFALCGSGMAVHHAWNAINGKIVDLTRSLRPEAVDEFLNGKSPQPDLLDRVLGEYPDTWVYLGVRFNRNDVQNYMTKTEQTGSIILDHTRGFPLWLQERLGNSDPIDPNEWEAQVKKLNRIAHGLDSAGDGDEG